MQPMIIDCDPGLDDALALLYAFGQTKLFDIKGIVTVGGNQTLEKVTNNACFISQYAPYTIPIIKGTVKPLLKPLHTSSLIHGSSGMGNIDTTHTKIIDQNNMLNYYEQILTSSEHPVAIVALGPLTNIAILISQLPHLLHKIKYIALMGGAMAKGNVTPCAEFNIFADPHSAKIVFDSNIQIFMCGLDATHQAYMLDSEIEVFPENTPVSKLAKAILKDYLNSYKKLTKDRVYMHDLCPLAFLSYPEYFNTKQARITVILEGETEGMTLTYLDHPNANVSVVTYVDREQVIAIFTNTIANLLTVKHA